MSTIAQLAAFVNKQADRLEEILRKHPEDKRAKGSYKPLIQKFRDAADALSGVDIIKEELELLRDRITAQEAELDRRRRSLDDLDVTPRDLEGLPPEVLQQLSIGESDLQEFTWLKLIEAAGGAISLDKLIIEIFRATGEAHDRQKLNARLYRMAQKGLLYSIPNRRGVYSIYKPSGIENEEAPVPRGPGASSSQTSTLDGGDQPSN